MGSLTEPRGRPSELGVLETEEMEEMEENEEMSRFECHLGFA